MAKKEKNKAEGKNKKTRKSKTGKMKKDRKTKELTAKKKRIRKDKKQKESENDYLAKWTAPEFIKNEEENLFYYASAVLSFFMVIWSFLEGNTIVAITFGLLIAVIVLHIFHKPRDIEYRIDLDGITVDDRLYRYSEIESFEIVQNEENSVLKFKLKNSLFPIKEIHLANQDPNYIYAALEYFLPEKEQEDSLISFEKEDESDEYENSEKYEEGESTDEKA